MLLIFFINNISIPKKYIVDMCNRLWEKRPHLDILDSANPYKWHHRDHQTAKAEEASLAMHASQQSVLSLPQKQGNKTRKGTNSIFPH
jgi:hypothetical protein